MKKWLKVLLAAIVAITIVTVAPQKVNAVSNFNILHHAVDMTVSDDGSIHVSETMSVCFTAKSHGIYVYIPTRYQMRFDLDGVEYYREYRFPVSDMKVTSDHSWETESYDNYEEFIIGSSSYYANTYETYQFEYVIHTKDLDLNGVQMLFMNIVSNNWNTTTDAVTFSISMPKNFDSNDIQISSPDGISHGVGQHGALTVSRTGNVISGHYSRMLQPDDAITIQLDLGNNYFNFPDINVYAKNAVIISAILAVIMAILYVLFGLDDKIEQTTEYHSPDGLNPAEVGMIIDFTANDQDVISIILDWGRRGIIAIVDEGDDLRLNAHKELEPNAKAYETILYDKLFAKKTTVTLSSMQGIFYETLEHAKQALRNEFTGDKALITPTSKFMQFVVGILTPLPFCIGDYFVIYNSSYDVILAWIVAVLNYVFIGIGVIATIIVYNQRFTKKKGKELTWVGSGILLGGGWVLNLLSTVFCEVSVVYSFILLAVTVACLIIVLEMPKRTPFCNQMLGQILGLQDFILSGTEDKMHELLDENPYYFYDILPYAYALGLFEEWNEHFKNLTIQPCQWYYCPTYYDSSYMCMHSLHHRMQDAHKHMASLPPSSGGSSGGYSSSGGGFSGGGFGGSGGGSW